MNAQQYADYQSAVASFLERNQVKPGCHGPTDAEHGEPFFSWAPCECCGSRLGGNRETYSFACNNGVDRWNRPNALGSFTADICSDCVYYLAYSQLDDSTMLEIEASRTQASI